MTDEHGNEITNIDDLYSIPISFSIHDIQQYVFLVVCFILLFLHNHN